MMYMHFLFLLRGFYRLFVVFGSLALLKGDRSRRTVRQTIAETALAEHLGVNRSALSRELGRMKNEGLLEVEGMKMKII